MKTFVLSGIASMLVLFSYGANAERHEQCYDYITELVRSSNFDLSQWKVNSADINLIIDEDNDDFIRAKLFIETIGTGTIGWVYFNKMNNTLHDITFDPDNTVNLTFNHQYLKAYKVCLNDNVAY
ncbi:MULTISPECIES: hypothetical protein [Providencia]|uniref:hypothetical protein n=1 Tax=Providencia TaxID=586 RepID=UPI0012B51316|nr:MULTISPECIES: hypothetical protein [Providencia]MTB41580.1 hypothetical protein [Providencia sp. wls1949]MTC09968.1 hypothetical protein [Providencia sp. wls1948]QIC16693.1 hypothetical protein G3341_13845 [Providencia vermicola]